MHYTLPYLNLIATKYQASLTTCSSSNFAFFRQDEFPVMIHATFHLMSSYLLINEVDTVILGITDSPWHSHHSSATESIPTNIWKKNHSIYDL